MKKQAKLLLKKAKQAELPINHLVLDCDYKYTSDFKNVLKEADVRIERTAPRVPNQNAFVERWIGSLRYECLNRFICFGLEHLDYIVSEYTNYYNELRPHQSLDNKPLQGLWPTADQPPEDQREIVCKQRLGGVLKHYERRAA